METAVNYIPPLVLKKLEDGVSEGADDGSGMGVEGELGCVVPFVGMVTGVVAGQSFVEEDAGLGVVSTEGMALTSTSAWSTVGVAWFFVKESGWPWLPPRQLALRRGRAWLRC